MIAPRWRVVALSALAIGAAAAHGSPTTPRTAADFSYVWNFDAAPTLPGDPLGFDLYNNSTGAAGGDGVADFLLNSGSAPSWSDGILTIPNGANVFSQVWPVAPGLTASGGYTIEYRVRVTDTTGLGVSIYETPATNNNAIGGVSLFSDGDATGIYYGINTVGQTNRLRATVPADQFVTIRVAAEHTSGGFLQPNSHRYTIFVDGKRAGTNLTPSTTIANLDRLVFGDLGSNHAGNLHVDYLGFTPGSFSPGRTNHPSVTPFTLNGSGDPVVRPSDGALMTVVRSTVTGGTRTSFLTSVNNGVTWQNVGVMGMGAGQPGEIAGGMLMQVDPLSYVYVYRDPNSYSEPWNHATHQPLATASYDMWSIRSDDGGVTWKDQQKVLDGYTGAFINSIVTSSGTVIAPLADFDTTGGRGIVRTYYSTNKGATWEQADVLDITNVGIYAYGSEDGFMEPTVTQRYDGSLYMLLRTTQGYFWQTESFDDGQSWTAPVQSALDASNSPGYLLTLADGDMALIWNRLTPQYEDNFANFTRNDIDYAPHPTSQFREEVSLAFSSDGGLTWTDPYVVAANPGGTNLQYSRMFERYPGEIWMRIGGQWLSYVMPALLSGDANNDGVVDHLDFLTVEQNMGAMGAASGRLLGDANDDGRVDGADLLAVERHFGSVLGGGATTPEPASGLLLLAAAIGGLTRRRG